MLSRLHKVGIWAEYAYNGLEISNDFEEWVIGLDYTFDFQTYCMVEFYRNGLGKNDDQVYTLNDWMRYLNGEQKALSRDQCYFFVQHPVTDFMQLGVSAIYSISDGSVALLPTLNWSPFQNVEIMAYANILKGNETAVYNPKLGNGGLVRVRVYF